ncbi:MAG TPA: MFS transporter [Verrucomicrobiae bacterium]|jgi:MFS family permease|nr:MFS transporter [Verrucomicrobiae bacterium]
MLDYAEPRRRRFWNVGTLRSLRHRNFRLLLYGAFLSAAGDFMQNIAQSWLVWQLTRSPVLLGVVGFFDTVPRLFFGALGGAIADRVDRRRLLMLTQTLGMAQAFIYWFLVYFQLIVFWHIIVLAFFLGAVNTVNQLARQSLVNSLVPREELMNAIGLQSSVFNLSKIVGPSAGGVMIAVAGIAGCFFVNALSFLGLIYTLVLMELPPWEAPENKKSLLSDIHEGFNYLTSNRRLFWIIALSYVIALVGAPYQRFLPMFATNILHVGPTGFGVLVAAPGVGATLSALTLASLGTRRLGLLWICSCALAFGVVLGLFAFSHSFGFSLAMLALTGFFFIAFRASSNTAIQSDTPRQLLGRVLSLFFMDRGLWSLGGLLIGGSAAVIGIDHTLAVSALICALAAAGLLIFTRRPAAARQSVDQLRR